MFSLNRPLQIKAYKLDSVDSVPSISNNDMHNVKVIYFLRHGQGFHNLLADLSRAQGIEWKQFSQSPLNPYVMPETLDAPLTQKGRDQARSIQSIVREFPKEEQPELVVLSPNCRALQTGVLAFEKILETNRNVPFISHEMVREETGVHICDKRRPKSQQEKEFPMVDFSLIQEEDVIFRSDRRESKMEVGDR